MLRASAFSFRCARIEGEEVDCVAGVNGVGIAGGGVAVLIISVLFFSFCSMLCKRDPMDSNANPAGLLFLWSRLQHPALLVTSTHLQALRAFCVPAHGNANSLFRCSSTPYVDVMRLTVKFKMEISIPTANVSSLLSCCHALTFPPFSQKHFLSFSIVKIIT